MTMSLLVMMEQLATIANSMILCPPPSPPPSNTHPASPLKHLNVWSYITRLYHVLHNISEITLN